MRYKYHSVHAPIKELCAPSIRSAVDSPLPGSEGNFTLFFRAGTQGTLSTQDRSPGYGKLPTRDPDSFYSLLA